MQISAEHVPCLRKVKLVMSTNFWPFTLITAQRLQNLKMILSMERHDTQLLWHVYCGMLSS